MKKNSCKEHENTSFWKETEDDILFWNYSPNAELDIVDVKEIVEQRLAYTDRKPMYVVADVTNLKSITKEARDYLNCPEGGLKGIVAGAFIANHSVSTVVVNLYLKICKPQVPAKFFTKKVDAIKWLTEIKQQKNSN
jgi:hypothetical protein